MTEGNFANLAAALEQLAKRIGAYQIDWDQSIQHLD
ncbi:hypothetical protein JOC54_001906 [Alkalihalobacillus xiaoxiensis]|uniref:Uncharacterized protein n=1 Tax=Shouchella xiaoxiensis TaxID=766895 RepID=A0ABS2SWN1_9BACI|nr:hypothetical protein [Shouchella xiaoxiensis]